MTRRGKGKEIPTLPPLGKGRNENRDPHGSLRDPQDDNGVEMLPPPNLPLLLGGGMRKEYLTLIKKEGTILVVPSFA
jgi:hypothetical protein